MQEKLGESINFSSGEANIESTPIIWQTIAYPSSLYFYIGNTSNILTNMNFAIKTPFEEMATAVPIIHEGPHEEHQLTTVTERLGIYKQYIYIYIYI